MCTIFYSHGVSLNSKGLSWLNFFFFFFPFLFQKKQFWMQTCFGIIELAHMVLKVSCHHSYCISKWTAACQDSPSITMQVELEYLFSKTWYIKDFLWRFMVVAVIFWHTRLIAKALQDNKCYIKIGLSNVNKALCALTVIKNEDDVYVTHQYCYGRTRGICQSWVELCHKMGNHWFGTIKHRMGRHILLISKALHRLSVDCIISEILMKLE